MIVIVDESNLPEAAAIHSVSWQDSHRSFCSPDFIALHTPEHQREYLRGKMDKGSKVYMLVKNRPVGVVSVTGSLIEDLYILPEMQNKGYGTELLKFAVSLCPDVPTLWILENNESAARLYRRMGFKETGNVNAITDRLAEIEFSLEREEENP
ncbi:MAG: GNAT family N-acetyltransferase [Clostridia bacterium]|nr:GNAT family N-acetyltransferase [Clostridia bacterium]